jgi:hemolysin III
MIDTTTTPSSQQEELVPRFRGKLHQIGFFVAIPAGVVLVLAARGLTARIGATVFAVSLAGVFGTSAAYHRVPWSARGKLWMKRMDHSMIFILIAGTYTPCVLLVLDGAWRGAGLALVWGVAIFGVLIKMIRIDQFKALGGTLYITLGWLAVIGLPKIFSEMSPAQIALMFAGGLLYTGGAIVLLRNRPNPNPRVFGYHEVWHSFTLGASACHFAMVLLIVLSGH